MRLPLKNGTQLTHDITILQLLSDQGGSSLVYLAKRGNYSVIVKEYFPSEGDFYREENSCRIKLDKYVSREKKAELLKKRQRFIAQSILAAKAINPTQDSVPNKHDYHAFYFPECLDITDAVLSTKDFNGTESAYLLFSSVNGLTLKEFADKISPEAALTIEQVLIITRSILTTIGYLHNNRKLLHLDIKPDNIFMATDIPNLEECICFLLDPESFQEIGQVKYSPYISEEYAPPEILLLQNLKASKRTKESENLLKYVDTYSDTYSVAVCMYELLLRKRTSESGNKINFDWNDLRAETEQTNLVKYIKQDVSKVLVDYPYLVDKITSILSKGLYCLEKNDITFAKEFSKKRYASCTDFIADIDSCLQVLHNEGFHPEILAMHSREHFSEDYYFRKSGSRRSSEDLISDDSLFIQEWLPDVTE